MFCKNCGSKFDDDAIFCTNCGVKIADDMPINYCEQCGEKVDADALFCSSCGKKLNKENYSVTEDEMQSASQIEHQVSVESAQNTEQTSQPKVETAADVDDPVAIEQKENDKLANKIAIILLATIAFGVIICSFFLTF